MRYIALILLVVATSETWAEESKFSVGVGAGYGVASLKEVNKDIDANAAWWTRAGNAVETREIRSAFLGRIEASYALHEGILDQRDVMAIGLRTGYLGLGDGYAKYVLESASGTPPAFFIRTYDEIEKRYSGSFIPILAGIGYCYPLSGGIRLLSSLSGGIGFGMLDEVFSEEGYVEQTIAGTTTRLPISNGYVIPYRGTGFLAEVTVGVDYALKSWLSVGVDVAYRNCAMKVRSRTDVDTNYDGRITAVDVKKGDYLVERQYSGGRTDKRLTVDYGGVEVMAGVRFHIY